MQRLRDVSVDDVVPTEPHQADCGHKTNRWHRVKRPAFVGPAPGDEDPAPHDANLPRWEAADAVLEFGRFRVLLRQRKLVADGIPVKLGTRCFDLLVALLEADGSLVSKDELVSRVWPDIFVAEENLKTQINALRNALGEDRELIRTEFGRGYRFTGTIRSTITGRACQRATRREHRRSRWSVPQWACWQPPHVGWVGESRL
jgi:DNA-binding winged helix-turn-helix (wHTH) protein